MIRNLTLQYHGEADLRSLPEAFRLHPRDRMLVQVFSGKLGDEVIQELIDTLGRTFPGAIVLGTTTAGEIIGDRALDEAIVIALTCFSSASIRCALVTQNEDLAEAGKELAARLVQPDTRAIIAFGCGIKDKRTIFDASMLEALHSGIPEAIIAGGHAGDNGKGARTLVFTSEGMTDRGYAAVSIAGNGLSACNAYALSWVPIGKRLTITQADGARVYSIDGQTPYDIYNTYLGQEVADDLPLSAIDFPLMIERDGVMMAVHATRVHPDDSFDYVRAFQVGEQVRFGYCHAGLLSIAAKELRNELGECEAQAAFVYSCVSRKWVLGHDVLVELAPINALASSAGFFSYGEYFGRANQKPMFFNQTLTVLCLSESDGEMAEPRAEKKLPFSREIESRQFRIMRVLHRLVDTTAREIESMNLELAGLARKDPLTGLHNRRMLDEHLAREVRRLSRSTLPLSLIMLDVDHFKRYNDAYGHVTGDACLRSIGQVLQGVARRSADLTARYGGEEFAVVLPETGHEMAINLAETIREHIETLNIPHCDSPTADRITLSLGVLTLGSGNTHDVEGIIGLCDRELYRAKEGGRNRVCGIDLSRVPENQQSTGEIRLNGTVTDAAEPLR